MPSKKRINWAKIKAEYIAGGISQRKLAAKYGVTYSTLRHQAETQSWKEERDKLSRKIIAKSAQRAEEESVSNAVKLEQVKGLLIDRLKTAIETMPQNGGTHARKSIGEGDKKLTIDYDLLAMVQALEKLGGKVEDQQKHNGQLADLIDGLKEPEPTEE